MVVCPGEVITPEDVTTRKGDGGGIVAPRRDVDAFDDDDIASELQWLINTKQ